MVVEGLETPCHYDIKQFPIIIYYLLFRFSETIFDESEEHTYEMEYEEPKNDGLRVWTQCIIYVHVLYMYI